MCVCVCVSVCETVSVVRVWISGRGAQVFFGSSS